MRPRARRSRRELTAPTANREPGNGASWVSGDPRSGSAAASNLLKWRRMERMTREQMEAEFGAPGVENPKLLDLITVDPASGDVVLAMFERRPWGASPRQFQEIEEKINRYLGYVLDGFLVQHHPEHDGKRVVLRLDCVEAPTGEA